MACAEDGVHQALLPEKLVEEDFVSRKRSLCDCMKCRGDCTKNEDKSVEKEDEEKKEEEGERG